MSQLNVVVRPVEGDLDGLAQPHRISGIAVLMQLKLHDAPCVELKLPVRVAKRVRAPIDWQRGIPCLKIAPRPEFGGRLGLAAQGKAGNGDVCRLIARRSQRLGRADPIQQQTRMGDGGHQAKRETPEQAPAKPKPSDPLPKNADVLHPSVLILSLILTQSNLRAIPSTAPLYSRRHARTCSGHPRSCPCRTENSWMAGTSPAMTCKGNWKETSRKGD